MIELKQPKAKHNASNNNYQNLSYEEAFEKLKHIVEKMQMEQITLEETVNLYKEGKLLSEHCNNLLNTAKFEIEELIKDDSKV